MNNKYPNLNSPLIVGGHIVKNRFFFPNALPKTQQGPETFPADPIVSFYGGLAKSGCGIIAYADMSSAAQRTAFNNDERHFPMYDPTDPAVENYVSQLADLVHFYGSKLTLDIFVGNRLRDLDVVDTQAVELPPDLLDKEVHVAEVHGGKRGMTEEDMAAVTAMVVEKAKYHKRLGFDSGYIGPFYGTLGNFLSPVKNTRGDAYGGGFENRCRFPLDLIKTVRRELGEDFLLILDVNRLEADLSWEEVSAFVRLAEPYIDLILMRPVQVQTPFESSRLESRDPVSLQLSEKLKKEGIAKPIASWTGFMDFESMEEAVAAGRCDMIMAGRFVLCNPDMGTLLREGRSTDLTPCLLCNKCHGDTLSGPWVAVCSANPKIGLAARLERLEPPPGAHKKVAVIGGGPAGMAAALYCRKRGHEVVLFEKSDRLGGQALTARYPDFKWALLRWLENMTDKVQRSGAEIRLNTCATPEAVAAGDFDAVIAALGAEPALPDIPGAGTAGIYTPYAVYGHEKELGKQVVCVGGSETGVETALYLARQGHEVTLLCRKKRIAYDANPIHYVDTLRRCVAQEKNLTVIVNAVTVTLTDRSATYLDENGTAHVIGCDSVVAAGGMTPLQGKAVAFAPAAKEFFAIGDCRGVGNIQKCMRTAFAAACQL